MYFVFSMENVVYSLLYYFTGIYLNPRRPWKYVFRISILEDSPTRWTISNICSSNWIICSNLCFKCKKGLTTTTFSFTFVNVCCSCDISMNLPPQNSYHRSFQQHGTESISMPLDFPGSWRWCSMAMVLPQAMKESISPFSYRKMTGFQ